MINVSREALWKNSTIEEISFVGCLTSFYKQDLLALLNKGIKFAPQPIL
jgi:hypothetical protein